MLCSDRIISEMQLMLRFYSAASLKEFRNSLLLFLTFVRYTALRELFISTSGGTVPNSIFLFLTSFAFSFFAVAM